MDCDTLASLPCWAANLYAARNVRRWLQVYRKAHRRAPMAELFEQLALELDSGRANPEVLASLHRRLEMLLGTLDTPPTRAPVGQAMSHCEPGWTPQHSDFFFMLDCGLDRRARKADDRLAKRTLERDIAVLKAAADAGRPRAEVLRLLGPLWPLGEPNWLRARWPTLARQRRQNRRMWQLDAPTAPCRGASLRLSRRLPERLLELFEPTRFVLEYEARRQASIRPAGQGERSLEIVMPRAERVRLAVPGRHGFRPAAAPALRRAVFPRSAPGSLMLLRAFYREHDGGLLFRPAAATPRTAHVNLFGLADQARARRCVAYWMEDGELDRPDRIAALVARMGCRLETLLVLALINASFYLVPLAGRQAGRVFRYSARAQRLSPFAASAEEAFVRFVRDVVRLSGRFGPQLALGDEPPHTESMLGLRRVRFEDKG